jgi:LysR family transcriptional activator of nhaA
MLPFNYHHLYYFYVIAKEGSISKAARQLSLAQPTLSSQLKQFEEFLEVDLFTREKRRLALTQEGHLVLSYASMIFDLGLELKGRLKTLAEQVKLHIHIGVTPYVPKTIIDTLLNYILTTVVGTRFSVKEDRIEILTQDLADHLLDVILTDTPFAAKSTRGITNHLIGRIPIVFCANSSLAKKCRRFPEDLNNLPLILPAAPTQIYTTVREYLDRNHVEPEIIGEIEDSEIVRRLVLRGYGVAPLNLLTLQNAPSRQKLIILNEETDEDLCEKIYLITKKRKIPNPLLDVILENFLIEDFMKNFNQCKKAQRKE